MNALQFAYCFFEHMKIMMLYCSFTSHSTIPVGSIHLNGIENVCQAIDKSHVVLINVLIPVAKRIQQARFFQTLHTIYCVWIYLRFLVFMQSIPHHWKNTNGKQFSWKFWCFVRGNFEHSANRLQKVTARKRVFVGNWTYGIVDVTNNID